MKAVTEVSTRAALRVTHSGIAKRAPRPLQRPPGCEEYYVDDKDESGTSHQEAETQDNQVTRSPRASTSLPIEERSKGLRDGKSLITPTTEKSAKTYTSSEPSIFSQWPIDSSLTSLSTRSHLRLLTDLAANSNVFATTETTEQTVSNEMATDEALTTRSVATTLTPETVSDPPYRPEKFTIDNWGSNRIDGRQRPSNRGTTASPNLWHHDHSNYWHGSEDNYRHKITHDSWHQMIRPWTHGDSHSGYNHHPNQYHNYGGDRHSYHQHSLPGAGWSSHHHMPFHYSHHTHQLHHQAHQNTYQVGNTHLKVEHHYHFGNSQPKPQPVRNDNGGGGDWGRWKRMP
jgi:hypothetical protein